MLFGLIKLTDWFNSRNCLIDQNYITWMNILSQDRRVGVLGVVWSRSRITGTYKTFESRENTVISCLVTPLWVGSQRWMVRCVSSKQFIEAMLTPSSIIFPSVCLATALAKNIRLKGDVIFGCVSLSFFCLTLVSINPISTSIATSSEQKCCSTTYGLVSIKPFTTTATASFEPMQGDYREGWLINLIIALFCVVVVAFAV